MLEKQISQLGEITKALFNTDDVHRGWNLTLPSDENPTYSLDSTLLK